MKEASPYKLPFIALNQIIDFEKKPDDANLRNIIIISNLYSSTFLLAFMQKLVRFSKKMLDAFKKMYGNSADHKTKKHNCIHCIIMKFSS